MKKTTKHPKFGKEYPPEKFLESAEKVPAEGTSKRAKKKQIENRLDINRLVIDLFDEYFPDSLPPFEILSTDFSKISTKRARFLIKRGIEEATRVKFLTNKPLTKQQIISYLAIRASLPKWTVASIMEGIVTLATDEIKNKTSFSLPGIGKIKLAETRAISFNNPQTGRPIYIPAKRVLRMRFHNAFKRATIPIKKKGEQ